MTTNSTTKAAKTKKIDLAVQVFTRHLPTRDTMTKREWRALVVADMKTELGVTNAGTLGMYFAWSDQLVTGRGAKQYNRTAPRAPKGSVKAKKAAVASGETASDDELTRLANEFSRGVAAAAKKGGKKAAPKTLVNTL